MVMLPQCFTSDISPFGFHRYTEFGSNTTDLCFPTFNSCHLLDEMLFISVAKAGFWVMVLKLTLKSLLDHFMSK